MGARLPGWAALDAWKINHIELSGRNIPDENFTIRTKYLYIYSTQ